MKKIFNKIKFHIGIQGKLYFLFILLSTIPISFISIYVIQKQISIQKEEALTSVKNEVNEIKSKTSILLSRIRQELIILSKTTEAKNLIEDYYLNKNNNIEPDTIFEKEFATLLKDNGLYFKIELLDKIGRKVFTAFYEKDSITIVPKNQLSKKPLNFYKYLVKDLDKGEIKLSPSEIKILHSGKIVPLIDCVIPIFDDNNKLKSILISSIHAEDFFKFFTLTKTSDKIKVIMVNGEGIYLYHSQKKNDWNRLLAGRQEENLVNDYSKKVSDSILLGTTGTIADDPESIIEYTPIFSLGDSKANQYFIFTEIPKELAFASVNQLRDLLIFICITVAILSIIAGFYTSRLFLRPINKLIHGTRIIREGDLDFKLDIKTGDEIQDLVESFNQMVVHWKEKRELMEHQRLIEDVKERKKYLENIMDSSLDLLITLSSDGKLSFANNRLEDILGYKVDYVKGKHYLDFIPVNRHDFVKQQWYKLKNSNGVVYDTQIYKIDGSVIECLVSLSPLKGLNEYLAIIKDITARKQAEEAIILAKEKAEEANRLKTNIISNMGHELRTPMIGILGFSRMLKDVEELEDIRELGILIVQSSERLMQTLNLILEISKIESGFYDPDLTIIDLIELINVSVSIYKDNAIDKNLQLNFSSELTSLNFQSDIQAIQSILNNLIENAVKFTFRGSVDIKLSKEFINNQNYAIIEVSDTGIGIPEENKEIIFEAFRQGSEGLSRQHEGNGLGLTLTKKYLDIIGGTITVDSQVDTGSKFTVKIPITEVDLDDIEFEGFLR